MPQNNKNLLVPIHLDALVINNNENQKWKDTSFDLTKFTGDKSNGGLSYFIERKVDDGADEDTILPTGVHLHWVMPDGLRKGKHNTDTGQFILPAAPNRWLVVRMDADKQLKSWVVESDCLNQSDDAKLNWIKEDTTARSLQAIALGNIQFFDAWQEQNAGVVKPLTAIAPGNPDFAASYLHCKNVFGLYDDMTDNEGKALPPGVHLTYQVYGWYANPADSPLNNLTTNQQLKDKLAELGWSLQALTAMGDNIPDSVVFHAMVQNLSWQQPLNDHLPSPGDISIGIGNTTSEAMASLLPDAGLSTTPAATEKMLAAYQFKSLQDKGIEGDGLKLLQRQMHARSFAPVDGGSYWVIEPSDKDLHGDNRAEKDKSRFPFPTEVSDCLVELNKLQKQYDDGSNQLASRRAQLYALKYKLVFSRTPASQSEQFSNDDWVRIINKIKSDIEQTQTQVKELIKTLQNLKTKVNKQEGKPWVETFKGLIADKYQELRGLMDKYKMSANMFEIGEVAGDKYFEPVDPAVVIAGLMPSKKYFKKHDINKQAEENEAEQALGLVCRLSSQTASKITVSNKTVPASAIADRDVDDFIYLLTDNHLPAGIKSLFYESFVLNVLMSDTISLLTEVPTDEIWRVISNYEKNRERFKTQNSDQALLPPGFSVSLRTQQPWTPLYLEWALDWRSTYANLRPDILKAWKFGDNDNSVDFGFNTALTAEAVDTVPYSGRTLLSMQMANKISDINKKMHPYFNNDLFSDATPMAQMLGGFNAQLIQREHSVQLPIVDENLKVDDIYELTGSQNAWRPKILGKEFYPLRAGTMKLTMLRVIDSFGQVVEDLLDKNITPASDPKKKVAVFKSAPSLPRVAGSNYSFNLSPRIVQPARLKFDWLSADIKDRVTDSDPASNPVCGWLLYNKQDHNLSVFDNRGKEIAVIIDNKTTIKLIAPPGLNGIPKIENKVLQNVVDFIIQSRANFDGMAGQINKVIKKVQVTYSKQQITMALPTGFPMAVVAAKFSIDIKELPAMDQTWLGGASNTDFASINYTLEIGNSANKTDGLTGFFISNRYKEFILPFGDDTKNTPFAKTCTEEFKTGAKQNITMIMDPRTVVNMASGILPAFELPQLVVDKTIKDINLRVLAAPVLTPPTKLKVPLLQSNDANWEFITAQNKPEALLAEQGTRALTFEPARAAEGWLKLSNTTSVTE